MTAATTEPHLTGPMRLSQPRISLAPWRIENAGEAALHDSRDAVVAGLRQRCAEAHGVAHFCFYWHDEGFDRYFTWRCAAMGQWQLVRAYSPVRGQQAHQYFHDTTNTSPAPPKPRGSTWTSIAGVAC
jgi:hypothetical protein